MFEYVCDVALYFVPKGYMFINLKCWGGGEDFYMLKKMKTEKFTSRTLLIQCWGSAGHPQCTWRRGGISRIYYHTLSFSVLDAGINRGKSTAFSLFRGELPCRVKMSVSWRKLQNTRVCDGHVKTKNILKRESTNRTRIHCKNKKDTIKQE